MKLMLLILLMLNLQAKELTSLGMKLNFNYLNIEESSTIWGLDFINKDKMIYTTQKGKIFIYNLITNKKNELAHDLKNIKSEGQGGLLDIITYKDYVYVTFSESILNGSRTSIAKAKLNNKILNFEIIFKTKSESKNVHHYGSRLLINQESIFMTIGDRGERDKAQDFKYHNGKVLKLSLDGTHEKNVNGPIYSLGHRNPQGIAHYNDKIYVGEFGPQGGDEINILEANKNYGWPKITFGEEYGGGKIGKPQGYTMPFIYWNPSISFSGINFYSGDKIPKWKGHLFLACLGTNHLRRVNINNSKDQETLLKDISERFRMVRMSPDEKLYISFDSGKIGVISN